MRILFFLCLLIAPPAAAADLKTEMQQLESARNAAIAADDEAVLAEIYAPDFSGIAAGGATVDHDTLFAAFKRAHERGRLIADSEILSARLEGATAIITGHLKLSAPHTNALVSESFYLHVFRKDGGRWRMIAGCATPVAKPG